MDLGVLILGCKTTEKLRHVIPFLLEFPSLPTLRNETEHGTIWQIVVRNETEHGAIWQIVARNETEHGTIWQIVVRNETEHGTIWQIVVQ